ncbi:AmmeMemoRadiSam system protein B [bacterium]|nr:AmmeMemoRadiSam system protein B [bacterium]NBX77841.1 AmmeMemoRadiSam system protein B [bacterium]
MNIVFFLLCSFFATHCSDVFISHLSNAWYPQTKAELQALLEDLDAQSVSEYGSVPAQSVKATLVPHAGYIYSGVVAAATYRSMKPKKRFIILAPSHFMVTSYISLPRFSEYRTPLGLLSVDVQVIKDLSRHDLFRWDDRPFEHDHALEIQLPFIQFYFPQAQIIPLFVGQLSVEQLYGAAKELLRFVDAQTGIIVSSDLTHYGKRFGFAPFKKYEYERVRVIDSLTIAHCSRFIPEDFLDWFDTQAVTVCGKYPLLLLSCMGDLAQWNLVGETVAYRTSTESLPDVQKERADSFVTYAGVVLKSIPLEYRFSEFEKEQLRVTARRTLRSLFLPEMKQFISPVYSYNLQRKDVGCFVTLYAKNEQGDRVLRGCVGSIESGVELAVQVEKMTRAAATKDDRFAPVQKHELDRIEIEISIVHAPQPIIDYKDIKLGMHGIIIQLKDAQAVYLPEVPVEQRWNIEQTLQELCKKAGLAKTIWNHPQLKLFVFTTEKII